MPMHHVTELRHRRVSEYPLDVGLRHGNQRREHRRDGAHPRDHHQRRRIGTKRSGRRRPVRPSTDNTAPPGTRPPPPSSRRGSARSPGRPFHRVRQPHVQREPARSCPSRRRKSAARCPSPAAMPRLVGNAGPGAGMLPGTPGRRRRTSSVPVFAVEPDHPQQQAQVADARGDERLFRRRRRRWACGTRSRSADRM